MSQETLFTPAVGRVVAPVAGAHRTEMHADIITIALPGGRCLRLAAMDGALIVADGYESDGPLRAIARGLLLPCEMWPAVRRALDELAEAR
jgi:hypothetical protein